MREGALPQPADEDDVVVVAAGSAWPLYSTVASAYICQNGRQFRPVGRLGFYSLRTIYGLVPKILKRYDGVVYDLRETTELLLSTNPWEQQLGRTLQATRSERVLGVEYTVLLLSDPESLDTARFDQIHHDGPAAWTMNQRYQKLPSLVAACTTADLT